MTTKPNYKYAKLILLVAVFICHPVIAGNFNRLNEEQGLSSRRSFSIRQDKNGFIWIATKLSIDRYDGRRIKRYELAEPNQSSSGVIGFNYVTLAPDSSLWAFTQSGLVYKYDDQSDEFLFIYSIRDFYKSYNITLNYIFFEDSNTLLLATTKGILRFDTTGNKTALLDIAQGIDVYHICKEQDIYYVSTKEGLYLARLPDRDSAVAVNHLLKGVFVNRVYYDTKYRLFWVGTFSDGIYVFPKQAAELLTRLRTTVNKPVRAIISYNERQLAVGVDGEGVLLFNRQTQQVEKAFAQIENEANSLSGNSVYDLLLDDKNLLWVATYHNGVSYTDRSKLKFGSFVHEKRNENSIVGNYVNAVIEDRDGDLWFGTNNGISLFARKTGKWTHFFRKNSSTNGNVILTLCEDSRGKIWAGGYAFGCAEIDKRTGRALRRRAGDAASIIGTEYIYAIYREEHTDKLWMGGIHGKISCYDVQTGESRLYDAESLRCFSSYNDSMVVLGLYRGIYLLNKNTGALQPTRISNTVNQLLKDGDREYWVGTSNGLYYYDFKADSLRHYTKERDGLLSNHVYAIEKDEMNNLWISTEEGLNKLFLQTGKITSYNTQDGLISNQFIPNASFRCSSSEMLFGTADGAVLFYPSEIKKSSIKEHYPLIFTELRIFGNRVKPKEKASPLSSSSINETAKIVLPHNKNYFSISFTLPCYQFSDKTEYSFYLKDYDLNWNRLSTSNTASYSKIQPGKYVFFVRACIDQQLQEERQIEITVKQPWWNTVWAWFVYVLLLAVSTYFIIKRYEEQRKKKQTEEKMDFFINTAHDILTPLSLIEAPLKDMTFVSTLTNEAKYLLSLALNNTRKLNHFVHQLIDFQRVSLNAYILSVTKNNVYDFFVRKTNAYKRITSQKFISLVLHIPKQDTEVFFDKEKVNKITDNLLSNAIKYTPFGGKIEIHISFYDNEWSFAINNNGSGISPKNRKLIFKHIFRDDNEINAQNAGSGVGLKMVHALVNIHKGKIAFSSKKDETTEFIVTLPYRYDEKDIDESAPAAPAGDFTSGEEAKARLFLVESDPEMASFLQNSLSREYSVKTYPNAEEALNQILQSQPELLIVDSLLSDMDGFSFCRKIKENADIAFVSIIMITETSDEETVKEALVSGAGDFVKKPFDLEILRLKISSLLSTQSTWQKKALMDIRKSNIMAINNDRDEEFMSRLVQLIEQNLDNPELNVSVLCRELALSRTLLYNRVTQLTNSSPNEFIRIIRLKNAANFLIESKYSIAEVSNMIGIDNPKYFSRIFKEYYGVPPKNYLKE
ncbi:MAG: response regulator [Prevotellaceae bacterium]|jgi:signal transduction histidine kinase/ligand-binding sensor domain-containing protein/DNA-binding response OmpR family regulator|nr:response regulator [Prevotellaceae bacterium]